MRRHRELPKGLRDSLALERGERVLASAADASGRWCVGTDRALFLPADDDKPPRRIVWQEIERAEWDQDADILRVTEAAPFGERLPVRVVRLEDPRRLLSLIRERVTASVIVSQHVPLRDGLGVRVVARRRPGSDDPLVWSLAFDEGLDPDAPGVLDAAEVALTEVRGQVEL